MQLGLMASLATCHGVRSAQAVHHHHCISSKADKVHFIFLHARLHTRRYPVCAITKSDLQAALVQTHMEGRRGLLNTSSSIVNSPSTTPMNSERLTVLAMVLAWPLSLRAESCLKCACSIGHLGSWPVEVSLMSVAVSLKLVPPHWNWPLSPPTETACLSVMVTRVERVGRGEAR